MGYRRFASEPLHRGVIPQDIGYHCLSIDEWLLGFGMLGVSLNELSIALL